MESLYRTYRPLTFESVVGQEHIVSTIRNAVTEGRLSHAYLFCGPRGTGKTTMARILAKALLCGKAAGSPAGTGCMPDGTCPACDAIAHGTHPDVYELDAASRTGVDNVREEIVNSVGFAPVQGVYKVYIIDEVHMLTTAAFNALLKTLEEPPSHVVFVLCTTDPQKIPETILSRCQRFDFHRIGTEDLVSRMRYICEQEGFTYDDEALEIVAKHARGGMRDALSTLEQLSVFGNGVVCAADARSLLGETPKSVLAAFSRGIAGRDVVGLFGLVRDQVEDGGDLMELIRDLVGHLRDVYTVRVAGAKEGLVDGTPEEVAVLGEEAALFEGPDRLARALTVLDDAALEMRDATDARLVLEIALTRLARPESDLTIEAVAERLSRLEAQIASGVPAGPMSAAALQERLGQGGETGGRPAGGAAPAAASHGAPAAGPQTAAPAPQAVRPGEDRTETTTGRLAGSASAVSAAATAALPTLQAPAASGAQMPATSRPGVERTVDAGHRGHDAASDPAGVPAHAEPGASGGVSPVPARPRRADAPQPVGSAPEPHRNGMAPAPPAAPAASAEESMEPAGACVVDPGELQRRWSDVVKRVTAAQASRGGLLQSSHARSDDGARLVVGLPAGSGFAIKMLARPDSTTVIAPIVAEVFGPRTVEYVMDGAPAPQTAEAVAPAPQAAPPQASSRVRGGSGRVPRGADHGPAPTAGQPDAPLPHERPSDPASVNAAAPAPVNSAAPVSVQGASADEMPPWEAEASSSPATDAESGPTVVPEPDVEADRRAWEDERVPYGDAAVASYEDGRAVNGSVAGDPGREPRTQDHAPDAPAGPTAARPDAPSGRAAAASAMPWSGKPTVDADEQPETVEDAKSMLGEIFGAGVVFKNE